MQSDSRGNPFEHAMPFWKKCNFTILFYISILHFYTCFLFFSDLDYFEEAVDFLYSHESICSEKGIGVVGISKSAEIGKAIFL